MTTRALRPVFWIPFIFLCGIFVAKLSGGVERMLRGKGDFLGPIADVRGMLEETYVEKPDSDKLQRGAIDGMLQALDDPYAEYIPPSERAAFEKQVQGHFVGIGALVQVDPPVGGVLTVVSPLEDSPAYEAGVLAGDKIVRINGEPTVGLSVDECVRLLTGKPGTVVHVGMEREGRERDFEITRREITVRAVKGFRRDAATPTSWEFMIDPASRIAYVRLTQFLPSAHEEFRAAMKQMGADSGRVAGMILDLRDNPGGDMSSCLKIADLFLERGIIVSVRGREENGERITAQARGTLPDFPLAVVVNRNSASASEILAGAIADHSRGIVVGARTFGKGVVQTVRALPRSTGGEALLKYTIQRYYLPSGRQIHRDDESVTWGVDPTPGYFVDAPPDDQVAAFLKRRDLDVIRPNGGPGASRDGQRWDDPEWVRTELLDAPLAAALEAVQGRLRDGEWRPVSDAQQQPTLINLAELRRLERAYTAGMRDLMRVEKRIERLGAGSATALRALDLWPDSLDLRHGTVEVRDKVGNVVSVLRITGRDLERWLASADVEVVNEGGEGDAEGAEEAK